MNVSAPTTMVDANGLRFPVVDCGAGPPILLLHGFPNSRHLWRHQIPVLAAAGFRVIAPDLRGFGDAPKPQATDAYQLPTLLQDVIGILDTLDVDRPHIIGHDWGAAVAWRIVAYYPHRVGRFMSLSVGHPENSGWETLRQRELFWYHLYFQFAGVAEEWLSHDNWTGLRIWTRGQGDLDSAISALARPGALTAALNWYRALSKPRPVSVDTPALPPISCPVLGIWSDGDVFISEAAVKNSVEKLPGAAWQYERITGAGHWLMLDKPDTLNHLAIEFLSGQLASGSPQVSVRR